MGNHHMLIMTICRRGKKVKNITPLLILIAISLMLSGCVGPDVGDNMTRSTPVVGKTAPTPTPTPAQTPTPAPTRLSNASTNDTNDSVETWSVCDPRHNESWLYAHKCGMYAHGGGGGGNHHPPPLVPETPSVYMVAIGLVVLKVLQWRNG